MDRAYDLKQQLLDTFLFEGLTDLNTGFDAKVIKYFSKEDFEVVMERAENYGIGICGIEPWPDGEFCWDVKVFEEYTGSPFDSNWYWKAFHEFLSAGITSHFAASYKLPEYLLLCEN